MPKGELSITVNVENIPQVKAYIEQLEGLLREAIDFEDHDERQNPDTLVMERTCPDCWLCRAEVLLASVHDESPDA